PSPVRGATTSGELQAIEPCAGVLPAGRGLVNFPVCNPGSSPGRAGGSPGPGMGPQLLPADPACNPIVTRHRLIPHPGPPSMAGQSADGLPLRGRFDDWFPEESLNS